MTKEKEDTNKFRVKKFPTLQTLIGAVFLIVIQVGLLSVAGVKVLETKKEEVEAVISVPDVGFDIDGVVVSSGIAGGSDDGGYNVAVQPDGKVVVAGYSHNGSNYDLAVWRYNDDGSLDTTFNGTGYLTRDSDAGGNHHDFGNGVAIQADGKIVIAGESRSASNLQDMAVWRFNSDGSLDTTFNGTGYVTRDNDAGGNGSDVGNAMVIQNDGKIVIAGASGNSSGKLELAVWRLNSDGSMDTSFDSDGVVLHTGVGGPSQSDQAWEVKVKADGKVVVVGQSTTAALNTDMAVWSFNSDGSSDNTFDTDGYATHNGAAGGDAIDSGNDVAIQTDGKIVISGSSNNGSNSDFALWRYNTNGSLDTTFDGDGYTSHGGAAGGVGTDISEGVAIQSDGKIVATGYGTNASGADDAIIWRYNSNGSLDTSFDSDGYISHNSLAGATGYAGPLGMTLDSDDRILFTGYNEDVGGVYKMTVWRYVDYRQIDNLDAVVL